MPDQYFGDEIIGNLALLNKNIEELVDLFNRQANKLEMGINSINKIEKSSNETQKLIGKSLDDNKQQLNFLQGYAKNEQAHDNEIGRKLNDTIKVLSKEAKETNYGVRNVLNTINAHDAMANERNARIDELAKAREQRERAEYIATELWRSTLVSSIRDIIDNQVKAMTEMGKARGLDREETVALYQSVNTIRKDLNKNGGYIFSNEQVRIAFEALAKANLSYSEQKAYAGTMTKATALFPGAQGFENIIAKYNIIADGANKTQEEIKKSLDSTLGFSANLSKVLGKEYAQGEFLGSLNADRLSLSSKLAQNAGVDQTQGLKIEQAMSAELTVIGKRLGRNVAEGMSKIMNQTLSSMADPTAEGAGEYYAQVAKLLQGTTSRFVGKSMEDVRRNIAENPELLYKEILEPIMRKAAEGDMASSQFLSTNMDKKTIQELQLSYKGGRRAKILSEMNAIEAALVETEDDNIKHLIELNNTMAETQTIVERLKIGFSNFINDSTIGNFITSFGIGRGSLGDLAAGVSLIKGTGTTIGNVFGEKGLNSIKENESLFSYLGRKIKATPGSMVNAAKKVGGFFGKAGRFMKPIAGSLGKKIPLLGTLISAGMLAQDASEYEAASGEEKEKSAESFARTSMGITGALAGGAIGTAILPGIGTAIGAILGGLAGELVTHLDPVMKPIKEAIIPLLDDLAPYIKTIKEFLSSFGEWIKDFFGRTWNGLKSVISSSWNWIKERSGEIWNGIKNIFSKYINYGKKVWSLIGSIIGNIFGVFITGIRQSGTLVMAAIKGLIGGILKLVGKDETGEGWLSSAKGSLFSFWENIVGSDKKEENSTENKPSFRMGTKNVERDSLAKLHKGEMVLTHSLAEVFRHGVYNDIFNMAEEEAHGRPQDAASVMIKWAEYIDKSKVNPEIINLFTQAVQTRAAQELLKKHNIDEILIISGLRNVYKQKKLAEQGIGSKTSAHLIGNALDFNFSSKGNILNAFVGKRSDNIVNEATLPIYKAFGDILEGETYRRIRSGANFSHKDPNHIELSGSGKQVREFLQQQQSELDNFEEFIRLTQSKNPNNYNREDILNEDTWDKFWDSKKRYEERNKQSLTDEEHAKWFFSMENLPKDVMSYGMTMTGSSLR